MPVRVRLERPVKHHRGQVVQSPDATTEPVPVGPLRIWSSSGPEAQADSIRTVTKTAMIRMSDL
jgi:hypothetical protein